MHLVQKPSRLHTKCRLKNSSHGVNCRLSAPWTHRSSSGSTPRCDRARLVHQQIDGPPQQFFSGCSKRNPPQFAGETNKFYTEQYFLEVDKAQYSHHHWEQSRVYTSKNISEELATYKSAVEWQSPGSCSSWSLFRHTQLVKCGARGEQNQESQLWGMFSMVPSERNKPQPKWGWRSSTRRLSTSAEHNNRHFDPPI